MRVSTESLDHGHDVCGAQAAGNWAEGRSVPLHVLHRPPEGIFFAAVLTVVLQRFSEGHPRRAGAPEGTADVDGTGAGYGLRSSCGVGHAVRG